MARPGKPMGPERAHGQMVDRDVDRGRRPRRTAPSVFLDRRAESGQPDRVDACDLTFGALGYAELRGWITAPEIERMQRRSARVTSARPDPCCSRPANGMYGLRWNDPMVLCILRDRRLVDRIKDVVCATDLRWSSGYLSVKDRGAAPTAWHQDWWCWTHSISGASAAAQV